MTDDNGLPLSWTLEARHEFLAHELKQKAQDEQRDWRIRKLEELSGRVAQLEAVVREMPKALGTVIGKHVRQVLEQRQELAYRGTWSADEAYPQSSLITFDGGMWLAIGTPTKGRRPKADPSWRLVVKSAPDGGFA